MNESKAMKLGYIQPINWLMKIAENLREFRKKLGVVTEIEITNPITNKKYLVKALWDTGATYTCLSKKLAEEMKLEQVGFYNLTSPLGVISNVPSYNITLKVDPKRSAHYQIKAGVFEGSEDFDVALGLDLILNGKLSMWVENGIFNFEFIENIYK